MKEKNPEVWVQKRPSWGKTDLTWIIMLMIPQMFYSFKEKSLIILHLQVWLIMALITKMSFFKEFSFGNLKCI